MWKRTQHLQHSRPHSKRQKRLYIIIGLICALFLLLGCYKIRSNHHANSTPTATKTYRRNPHMTGIKATQQSKVLTKIQNTDSSFANVSFINNNQLKFTYDKPKGFNKFKVIARKQYIKFLKASNKTSKQISLKIVMSTEAEKEKENNIQNQKKQQQARIKREREHKEHQNQILQEERQKLQQKRNKQQKQERIKKKKISDNTSNKKNLKYKNIKRTKKSSSNSRQGNKSRKN